LNLNYQVFEGEYTAFQQRAGNGRVRLVLLVYTSMSSAKHPKLEGSRYENIALTGVV